TVGGGRGRGVSNPTARPRLLSGGWEEALALQRSSGLRAPPCRLAQGRAEVNVPCSKKRTGKERGKSNIAHCSEPYWLTTYQASVVKRVDGCTTGRGGRPWNNW